MNSKKGFLLLEVIVSIAIITGALVFVTRIYTTAKYALQRSSVMFVSSLLLESKIFEFEEKCSIERDFKDGKEFTDDKDYRWSINSVGLENDPVLNQKLGLNLVTMEVLRNRDRQERKSYVTKYYLTTYLYDKK
ncbi:MAG: type II secretion system protein [Candidatus Omnitrophota bacterium]|nr:type II secretion system protein [Candidatus Omnitrophota bacterium]